MVYLPVPQALYNNQVSLHSQGDFTQWMLCWWYRQSFLSFVKGSEKFSFPNAFLWRLYFASSNIQLTHLQQYSGGKWERLSVYYNTKLFMRKCFYSPVLEAFCTIWWSEIRVNDGKKFNPSTNPPGGFCFTVSLLVTLIQVYKS